MSKSDLALVGFAPFIILMACAIDALGRML